MPKILAVHAMPGINLQCGSKRHAGSSWTIEHHTDSKVEERSNGDVWFTGSDGKRYRYGKHAIAWILDDGKDEQPAKVESGVVLKAGK